MIVGLDVGFGYTKRVTAGGTDLFPSVVGEWSPGGFRLGAGLDGAGRPDGIEGLTVDGRSYAVGERALRLAHRRFVGLSRQWIDGAASDVASIPGRPRRIAQSSISITRAKTAAQTPSISHQMWPMRAAPGPAGSSAD